jgi:hypothetical protein
MDPIQYIIIAYWIGYLIMMTYVISILYRRKILTTSQNRLSILTGIGVFIWLLIMGFILYAAIIIPLSYYLTGTNPES